MKDNYFSGCATVAEIKSRFRVLMMEHHPDRHPQQDREWQNNITAAIIALYHSLLAGQHKTTHTDEQGKEHTYYYNEDQEQAVIDKLSEVLALGLPDDVEVWIIGKWLWVKGNTKPHAKKLNKKTGIGLAWHSKRFCWYFKPYKGRTFYNKSANLDQLAGAYGAKQFYSEKEEKAGAMATA